MGKVIGKCRTIEDEALETNLPLGLGSLLATLKHMVAAERVWLDRWRFHSKSDWPSIPDSIDKLEAMFTDAN